MTRTQHTQNAQKLESQIIELANKINKVEEEWVSAIMDRFENAIRQKDSPIINVQTQATLPTSSSSPLIDAARESAQSVQQMVDRAQPVQQMVDRAQPVQQMVDRAQFGGNYEEIVNEFSDDE